MKINRRMNITAFLALALLATLAIGCGDDYSDFTHNAPDGSVIVFSPSGVAINAGDGIVVQPISIRVADQFNEPMNGIKLIITGGFASPFIPSLYEFWDVNGTVKYESGFTGVTDSGGVYNFSIHIPYTAFTSTGVPFVNSFTDNIAARSGSVFNDMEVKYNQ